MRPRRGLPNGNAKELRNCSCPEAADAVRYAANPRCLSSAGYFGIRSLIGERGNYGAYLGQISL